jgi:hypothetical protein
MWILSGVFFSAQRFPDVVHRFISALPLTALIDALRGTCSGGPAYASWRRNWRCSVRGRWRRCTRASLVSVAPVGCYVGLRVRGAHSREAHWCPDFRVPDSPSSRR